MPTTLDSAPRGLRARTPALALLGALAIITPSHADAAVPTAAPKVGPAPAVRPGVSPATPMLNGGVQVSKECSPEFLSWVNALTFYERPYVVCALWKNKKPTEWARWHLFKRGAAGKPNTEVASGDVPPSSLASATSQWAIDLKPHLPEYNTTAIAQDYLVTVTSKFKAGDTKTINSSPGKLTQLPQAGETVPPKVDPYTCTPGSYSRDVRLEIPKMTVNSTSSTPGDGGWDGRDELYFDVSRRGPLIGDIPQTREPNVDDYYEAKNGQTSDRDGNPWTNKDGKHAFHPLFWSGTIKHGETVTLAIRIGEQDNSDLAAVKNGIVDALHGIAQIAKEIPGYGELIAAIAEAAAGAAGQLPNTSGHDVIGFASVRLQNKCGNVQSSWLTFAKKNFPGAGTISNDFLDVETQTGVELWAKVLNIASPGFYTDYAPFIWAGADDSFWWIANGTSGSSYSFVVEQHVTPT